MRYLDHYFIKVPMLCRLFARVVLARMESTKLVEVNFIVICTLNSKVHSVAQNYGKG